MIATRIVRQFLAASGVVEQLAADFVLPDAPTMGIYLALAHVPQLLKVVSVALRLRAEVGVVAQNRRRSSLAPRSPRPRHQEPRVRLCKSILA